MEAEEPPHGVFPIPAIAEFSTVPEVPMGSSQIPALEPEAQEGEDLSHPWREECRPFETQQRESGDVTDYAVTSMASFPKEGPTHVGTKWETLVTEACDSPEQPKAVPQSPADRQARTIFPPEPCACPLQGEHLDVVSISSDLDSRVEVEFLPEFTTPMLGSEQAEEKEETTLDTFTPTRYSPSCKEHPTETSETKDPEDGTVGQEELLFRAVQGSWRPEELWHPQEAQGLEGQGQQKVGLQGEGALSGDNCDDGLWGQQTQRVEQTDGEEGVQRREQNQAQDDGPPRRMGEREWLPRGLEGPKDGAWGQEDVKGSEQGQEGQKQGEPSRRDSKELEESRGDSCSEQCQSWVEQSEEVTGKQRAQGLKGDVLPVDGSEEEPGGWGRGSLARVGEEGGMEEEKEHHGLSTLALVTAELSSPHDLFPDALYPRMQSPGTQAEPRAEELSPLALPPTLEHIECSHQLVSLRSSFPTGESLDNETTQDSQQEASELGKGTMSCQQPEEVSANASGTPPRTMDSPPSSLAEVSPVTPSWSSASIPSDFPSACSLEVSRASLLTDKPSPSGTSKPRPASLHDFPSVEATLDPCASSDGADPDGPFANCTGAIPHIRCNSFPGSHRTAQNPDLLGMSLSFSHSELPQRPPKPAIYGSVIPRRDRRSGRDCNIILESPSALPVSRQDSQELASSVEQPSGPASSQPWEAPLSPDLAAESPACGSSLPFVSMDMRSKDPLPPPPLEKRHVPPSMVERDGHLCAAVPTLKRHNHAPPLVLGLGLHSPPKGPRPQIPDPLVSRQHRPLPCTPDSPQHTQTSFSPRLKYNKPLPPTPDMQQSHHSPVSSSISRRYRPLPPVPIMDPPSEPPPLPPKSRGKSRTPQEGLMNSGSQAKARPVCQDWTVSTAPSAGRTSWPPAVGRSTESLASTSRSKSEVSPSMAFSNMTNLLRPSSPTTPWTQELPGPTPAIAPGLSEESEAPARETWRRTVSRDAVNGSRKPALSQARQPEKPSHLHHPQLEKASSWPHRRDPGRQPGGGSGQAVVPAEGPNKHKGWNRQGLRRPSILPEAASDSQGPAVERFPNPSDTIVFREKKPKETSGGFSRRCSKLINSSQVLYQEYSDVFLNKEIQSQQRLDSLAEVPGPMSPRQPRKALVSSESYLQRLSVASSSSLWQEIPVVRNSTVLLSMTHEDQKLQEAKFELILSEASYLRSLHVAVDHFQLSTALRATLSNQEHQWLFSRLQDVRDVSTTFLSDLEENLENNIFSFQVCDVVLSHAPDFRRVYLPYVTNQTYQERTFQSLLSSNSSFREVLEKLESDPVCQRLSLKSFLILPFQRITRLKLLLQNILKRTQPGSSEEAEATKAHHALEELIRDCNSNVQRMRRTEELIYLSQKIEFECKIFPLISQSRWLVKSGELTALEFSVSPGLRRKLNTRPVHLHLFNDCLLLSRPREGSRFLVFDHAPFSSIRGEKCEMKLHGPHKNLFRLFLLHNAQGTQAEFLFRTETQSEKLRWISALAMPREELDLLECYDSPQVQCLRAYKPRENDELALEKADVVMLTQQSSDGWLEGVRLSDGERGWFPMQQVEFISNPEVRARNLKEAHRVKTAKLQLVEQQA
ncbi:rho guanine nucleotide exchange factor 5 isoform X2 [Otolemur garnettii]|uniref:Rho guanine nucleotide exchange factor 5 n=1 Tax=Otolemur garnettii TaxID=30611 RepID=H0X2M0_OTOGA|nr:rho guanine nucleotide exchange factor 5 isoform X2 [Otolemur garnettii]